MFRVGIDFGGKSIKIGLVDQNGNIIDRSTIPMDGTVTSEEAIRRIDDNIRYMQTKNVLMDKDISSIGVGFPGLVDNDGFVQGINVMFDNVNLAEELGKHINVPIYVENDANCMALAEHKYGSLKGSKFGIGVTLGTGIGGGIILGGEIYRGANGGAGEIGHQTIIMDGAKCGCGRSGCWEAYASTSAWERRVEYDYKKHTDSELHRLINDEKREINAETIFEAINKKDPYALELFKEHLEYIAEGIVSLDFIFQPEVISLGGGISGQKERLFDPLMKVIGERFKDCKHKINAEIKIAELGNDAGIVGAACLRE